jgi:hypothetical protein
MSALAAVEKNKIGLVDRWSFKELSQVKNGEMFQISTAERGIFCVKTCKRSPYGASVHVYATPYCSASGDDKVLEEIIECCFLFNGRKEGEYFKRDQRSCEVMLKIFKITSNDELISWLEACCNGKY